MDGCFVAKKNEKQKIFTLSDLPKYFVVFSGVQYEVSLNQFLLSFHFISTYIDK